MIIKNLRQGVRTGFQIGIAMVFLFLVGAIFILVKLIGGALLNFPYGRCSIYTRQCE
jgi:hypothetical protein